VKQIEASIDGATGVILMAIGFLGNDWRGTAVLVTGFVFLSLGLFRYFKAALGGP